MTTRNRVAFGMLGVFAALALVACSGRSPLAPSSASAGVAAASTAASTQGAAVPTRGGTSSGRDQAGHDANDNHGQDPVGHDVNDDKGVDAPGHDANDNRGVNGVDDVIAHDAGQVTGAIAGLIGQCPDLSFSIGTTTVTTSVFTRFRDAACRDLANGVTVEAKGALTGSTLAATDVQRQR